MKQIDEQRYLWLFRAFSILLFISVIANIVLLSTYFVISPEPKREAFFVNTQTGNVQEFYVRRAMDNGRGLRVAIGNVGYDIAEAYITDYVVNRESVFSDGMLMQKLWGFSGPVYYYSTKDVYNTFVRSSEYRNSLINRDKYVVSVDVEKPQYQPKANEWIVDVNLRTTDKNGLNPVMSRKKIRIRAEFVHGVEEKLNPADMWINPLGFKVTSYQYIVG